MTKEVDFRVYRALLAAHAERCSPNNRLYISGKRLQEISGIEVDSSQLLNILTRYCNTVVDINLSEGERISIPLIQSLTYNKEDDIFDILLNSHILTSSPPFISPF